MTSVASILWKKSLSATLKTSIAPHGGPASRLASGHGSFQGFPSSNLVVRVGSRPRRSWAAWQGQVKV